MRGSLRGTEGGKDKENVSMIREKYKENQHQELIILFQSLKIHNISAIIKRIKTNYKSFFTKTKRMKILPT